MTIDLTDPRLAGRIISGDPAISLAAVVDQLTPDQMRAALHRLAALATADLVTEPVDGALIVREAVTRDGASYGLDVIQCDGESHASIDTGHEWELGEILGHDEVPEDRPTISVTSYLPSDHIRRAICGGVR